MTNQTHKYLRSRATSRFFLAMPFLVGMTATALADISNTAQVSGDTPGGTTITDSSIEVIFLEAPAPSFTIAKSMSISASSGADTSNPDGGDTITYVYVVTNTGNVALDGTSVAITDPAPTFGAPVGTAATNTLSAIGYVSGDAGTVDSIDVGEAWTFSATYLLAQADVDNAAGVDDGVTSTITGAVVDSAGAFPTATFDTANSTLTATETIAENGSLQLVKLASRNGTDENDGSGAAYSAGETVTYLMTVTNNGNVTMSTMTVSETAFTGTGGLGSISAISCATSLDATIATLAPGSSEVCTATYTIVEADL